ncbi:16356_t:CDS:2, partial [Rhizophagus irregularis]
FASFTVTNSSLFLMATTTNKLIEPYSSNMPYFTLTASNTPEELVKAATLLLSTIKKQPKLTNAFRMEVEISNENVLFRVCIDPVSWYDVYLRTKSRTEAVMIAKKYITKTRNKIPPEMDGPSVVNLNCEDLEKRKAYTPCNRTSFHAKNLCEYDHTEHICMVKVQTLDSREEICNFHCPTKLIFEKFPTEDYVMLL